MSILKYQIKYAPKNVREQLNKLISSRARNVARMRYSMVDEEYAALVNVPKYGEGINGIFLL